MFDKSAELFRVKEKFIFLNSCGVSPLYGLALQAEMRYAEAQAEFGSALFKTFASALPDFHTAAGSLLQVPATDIAFTKNSAEGLCMIANGFPFEPGDEVISYAHEYPPNHYPWAMQAGRGVKLKLLSNTPLPGIDCDGRPAGWSMDELESLITPRTKIVTLSHVQFCSGFAADLDRLGALCKSRNIFLVIDAAQSLGAMPVLPQKHSIAAVVSSGWKWLTGPLGSAIMHTTAEFRELLKISMVGPETMVQQSDYLNLNWKPLPSAARYEYSTVPFALAHALEAAITGNALRYGVDAIWSEIQRLQAILREGINRSKCTVVDLPAENRSGILSLITRKDPDAICNELYREDNVICTARGGYLRLAPHYYVTDEELAKALNAINARL